MTDHQCPLTVGGWRLTVGGWRLAVSGWQLAVGSWRLAVGGWRLADKAGQQSSVNDQRIILETKQFQQ